MQKAKEMPGEHFISITMANQLHAFGVYLVTMDN